MSFLNDDERPITSAEIAALAHAREDAEAAMQIACAVRQLNAEIAAAVARGLLVEASVEIAYSPNVRKVEGGVGTVVAGTAISTPVVAAKVARPLR